MDIAPEFLQQYQDTRPVAQRNRLCHAPWRSMYIGHLGRIVPCCANRDQLYGTYPELSLRQIWEGQGRTFLQAALLKGDFSLGCQTCGKGIASGNLGPVKTGNYDRLPELSDWPTKIEFELENTCNLECVMCNGTFSSSIRKNRDGLPPLEIPYGEDFLKELDPFLPHLVEADFYGGEPFLIENYLKIWERMIEVNPRVQVYVQTNGTILSNRVRNIVERIPMNIGISLDSVVPETYEAIRQNARFDRVIEHVEYFRTTLQSKNQHVFLSMCLLRQNAHELPLYMQFANERELEVYVHHVHWPPEQSLQPLPSDVLYALLARLQMGQLAMLSTQSSAVYAHNLAAYRRALETIALWAGQNRQTEIREMEMRRELGQLRYQTQLLIERAKATDELLSGYDTTIIEKCIFNWANQRDTIAEVLDRYQSTWNNLHMADAFQPIALTIFLFLTIEELNTLFENNNVEAMMSAYQVSLARATENSTVISVN